VTILLLKLHASPKRRRKESAGYDVDINKQKSLFFMELFLYLIFLDLDKMDVYLDKVIKKRALALVANLC
jgi:hypothetical protein